jgi:hypothetical protein
MLVNMSRSHERKTIPEGTSLATETSASALGESRLERRLLEFVHFSGCGSGGEGSVGGI